mgnify:FL=1
MKFLLDIQDVFFASGKAPVVLGVVLIIILGLGIWMFKMDNGIKDLEDQIDNLQ